MTFYVFFYLLLLLSFLLCAKLWCGMALVHIRPLNALWLKCPQRARVQKVSKKDASMFSHKTAPFYLFYLYRVKVPGRVRTLKGSECNGTKRKHDILHLPSPSPFFVQVSLYFVLQPCCWCFPLSLYCCFCSVMSWSVQWSSYSTSIDFMYKKGSKVSEMVKWFEGSRALSGLRVFIGS